MESFRLKDPHAAGETSSAAVLAGLKAPGPRPGGCAVRIDDGKIVCI